MKNSMKKLMVKGIGAFGDRLNEKICPVILYQPRACKRGERLPEEQPESAEERVD